MLVDAFQTAITSLQRNRGRTLLTVLGIVIGIAAVITVISAGEGIKRIVLDQVETFGSNIIQIEIKVPSAGKNSAENAIGLAQGIEVTTMKLSDLEAINKLSNVTTSYASVTSQQLVSYGSVNQQIILFGVSSAFISIDKTEVEYGRFFTNDEDKGLANVAVIGSAVREKLFGDQDFLDTQIKIGQQKFRVIGVMEERGSTFGFNMDELIFVPIQTLQKKMLGIDHLMAITSQVSNPDSMDETAAEIEQLMRQRHNISDPVRDDFAVTPMTEALEILDSVFWAISLLLIAVASISLLVGGVGIMNIMYVSVVERTYEIGLRKAVGASGSDILWQFLWEAVVVTFLGAVVGMMLGIELSHLITLIAASQNFAWEFIIVPSSLVLSSLVAIAIGLVFGIFPARWAARIDPVTALRANS